MGRYASDGAPLGIFLVRWIEVVTHVQREDTFEFYATEHFRMSGVYWGLTAMHLLDKQDMMDTEGIVNWVLSCQHPNGGFGGSQRHDPHLLYTLSAVQILALCHALTRINPGHVAECAFLVSTRCH